MGADSPPLRRTLSRARLPASLQSREGWVEYLNLRRPPQPHVHQIEPTNDCPHSCVMCPRPTRMHRAVGHMDPALFERLIAQVVSFDEPVRSLPIELFHFGESLLHPKLAELVAQASRRGLNVVLSVNAAHLTAERATALLAARPRTLIVSLDGNDPATTHRIRGASADHPLATANLEALARRVTDTPPETRVVVRIIELDLNRDQIPGFRQRWESLGLAVEVRPFFPWTEPAMARLGEVAAYPPHMPCPFPFQYMVVQWNGTVVGCCRDLNGELVLGDANTQSLQEIWDGPASRALRRQHATGDYGDNGLCRRCLDIYFDDGG